jgi:hypothetical protein
VLIVKVWGDHTKDEMGGEYDTHGAERKAWMNLVGNIKDIVHLEILAEDRIIISSCTLKNQAWSVSTGVIWIEGGKLSGLV